MLSPSTQANIDKIVGTLDDNNMELDIPSNSVVGMLLAQCPAEAPTPTDDSELSSSTSSVQELNKITNWALPNGDQPCEQRIAFVSNTLAKRVTQMFNFAQNEVVPMVNDLITQVNKAIDDRKQSVTVPAVIPYHSPELYGNTVFTDEIQRYSKTPIQQFNFTKVKCLEEDATETEVSEYLKTGNASMDDDLRKIVGDLGMESITDGFNVMFVRGGYPSQLTSYTTDVRYENLNPYIALYYFIVNGMIANPPEKAMGNWKTLERALLNVRNELGRRLSRMISIREDDYKHNRVVLSQDYSRTNVAEWGISALGDRAIIVNGDVWDDFLNDGGSVDIILGNSIRKQESYAPKILADATGCVETWRRHYTIAMETLKQNELKFARESTESTIVRYFNKYINDNVLDPEATNRIRQNVAIAAKDVSRMSMSEYNNLPVYLRDKACNIAYNTPQYLLILTTIDDIMANGDYTIKESVEVAKQSFIVSWLAQGLDITVTESDS